MVTGETNKNYLNPKVRIIDSSIHGHGLQAIESINRKEIILIWRNGYTNHSGAVAALNLGKRVMQWDDDVYSFETDTTDESYSINHSCDPNTWIKDAFTVIARRLICAGEEITIDYGLFINDPDYVASWPCRCGATDCRRRVTGQDWKNPCLQERYADHFSPYINKLISFLVSNRHS